jgi:hypothetical protein
MNRLPPRRIGRIVGFGSDAAGLNPGDPGYDSTTDPNSPDYVSQASDTGTAPGQGDVPINASSVPEGSTSQPSTASGTLNALSSGWNTVSNWFTGNQSSTTSSNPTNSSNVSTSNNSSTGAPTLSLPGSSSSTTSLASMSVLGVPLWLVAVAIGGIVAVNVFGKKGMGRSGGRRRSKRRGARRAHARRRGRQRNPAVRLDLYSVGPNHWNYTLRHHDGHVTHGEGFTSKSAAVKAARADRGAPGRGRRRKNPRARVPNRRNKKTGRWLRRRGKPRMAARRRRSR